MERERERRARPGEAPEPSGKRGVGVPPSSHTPTPHTPGKAPRAPPSRADAATAAASAAPYPPAAWPRPGWGGRDGGTNGRRAAAEPRQALPRRSGRTNGGARRRETGRDLRRPTAGGSRVPPAAAAATAGASARARARHASIREEPASQQPALAAPAVPPRFGWCGERKTAKDKPLCRGLTLNRSQRGSCSATYETPTQKQVVYEWFSARFHTNVRSTRRARGRPPFRPHPDSRDEWLSAPDPGPDARRGTRPRLRRTPARGPRRPTRTDRRRGRTGTRLSGADRGSRGAAVSFRLGGILT